ncbi:BT4734/BF3469 family protein [Mucilaginibacter sp.]|uniref:BT4734/BF3469 family protein n=1 Tax=Mucilaginibacter sp. TaxID=1882438 RepID=UPI00262C03C0|nr:BT4734/BF3469 family protein [Mucilaginibacter sp.]MDB4919828.1 VirE protein [Mucilaginibacter sp.]
MPGLISYYTNGITNKIPDTSLNLDAAIGMIRGGEFQDAIELLRQTTDKPARENIKKGLAYFTFSGTFSTRGVSGLVEHSGYLCLDFDDVEDLFRRMGLVQQSKYACACFLSPSGKGFKLIIKINPKYHAESFLALDRHFWAIGLEVDKSGKDVSRACFVSYDPDAYFNPESEVFEFDPQAEQVLNQTPAVVNKPATFNKVDTQTALSLVDYIVCQLEEQGIDLTNNEYDARLEIGFALATYGEDARALYHRVVQFNDAYTVRDADYKFNDALRKGRFQTPAKFFAMAKAAGVQIVMPKKIEPVKEVKAVDETPEPFRLINPDKAVNYWHLVIHTDLIVRMGDTPNLVFDIAQINKETVPDLKAIGNKVRLISYNPAEDFDLCDALAAQGFTIAINTFAGEFVAYHKYLIQHYTAHTPADDLSDNLLSVCEHISYYKNALEREEIAVEIAKQFKKAKATFVKEINNFVTTRERDNVQIVADGEAGLPAWIDADVYWKYGFDSKATGDGIGIYFMTSNGPKRLTNFVLTPLIHVYTPDEAGNRRFTELNNGRYKKVLQLPGKAFTSMDVFDTIITSEGSFFTYDGFTKSNLNKMKTYYLDEYPKCFELNTLGWQPEGFFSFSNLVFKNEIIEYNQYGIAEIDEVNYLSMGASSALEGVRAEDDIYKNDKYLSYNKAEIDFTRWCELMVAVFPEHGMMGVAFAMMSVFKDLLFKRNNNFPMLYAYGAVQAGKSKFAESVCNLFTHDMPMFNLNQGTDFAFFNLLGLFRNVAIGLNEFDENGIKEEWFRALKGAFDGEGRSKGSGIRNKTKKQEINAAIILIGQYLSTKDDNSVLSRTLPCKFTENNKRTELQISQYNELKMHEKKGISSLLCEVLACRQFVADCYPLRFETIGAELKSAFLKDGQQPKNRIIENYTSALTIISLISERIELGFTYRRFFDYCKEEIGKLANIMTESNSLSHFWKTVEFLLDQNVIEQGYHFKVEVKNEIRLDKKNTYTKQFEEPKKLLYLRLSTIHALYLQAARNQTGKMGQNEQTIITYMKDQEYYIGNNPGSGFTDAQGNSTNTSSYVFDYDVLGVNLERFKQDTAVPVTLSGKVQYDAAIEVVIDKEKVKFTLLQDESYTNTDGHRVKREILTWCLCDQTNYVYTLKRDREIKVTGTLNEQKNGDKVYRRMNVTNIEFTEAMLPFEKSDAEVDAAFGEAGK